MSSHTDSHDKPTKSNTGGWVLWLLWGVPFVLGLVIISIGLSNMHGGSSEKHVRAEKVTVETRGATTTMVASAPANAMASVAVQSAGICPALHDKETWTCDVDTNGVLIPIFVSTTSHVSLNGAPCAPSGTLTCFATGSDRKEHPLSEPVDGVIYLRLVAKTGTEKVSYSAD